MHATAGKTGDIGAAYYFDPATVAKGRELGLDGFRFYIQGRGGAMGDVSASMVTAAFGYFVPEVIEKMWTSARERLPVVEGAAAYAECNAELGRSRLCDVDGLDHYCRAANKIVQNMNPAGLMLFAGYAAQPVPDDTPAKAMHLAVLLRELRGSAHLMAIVANGLSPAQAHAIKRPGDLELFGYQEAPELTDADRAAVVAAEETTDAILESAYATLTDTERDALVVGTNAMHDAVSAASQE